MNKHSDGQTDKVHEKNRMTDLETVKRMTDK